MIVIADEAMGKILEGPPGAWGDAEGVIVCIEMADDQGFRSTMIGLTLAGIAAGAFPDRPVVMLGWQTPKMYAEDSRWAGVISMPNVVFRRLPEGIPELAEALREGRAKLTPS